MLACAAAQIITQLVAGRSGASSVQKGPMPLAAADLLPGTAAAVPPTLLTEVPRTKQVFN